MAREELPKRRPQRTVEFRFGNFDYGLSYGIYNDGRIGEVFIATGKSGTDLNIASRDAAILFSLALQFGCPMEVIQKAVLRNEDGSPAGLMGKVVDILVDQHLQDREQFEILGIKEVEHDVDR